MISPAQGTAEVIEISRILEQQRLSRFLVALVAMSLVVTFCDGFDTNLISFAAPYLRSEYRLDSFQLGKIFSIGLLGTLIGGFLFGNVGDRIGRRPAVILATALFGLLTLSFSLSTGYHSLLVLRFLDGLPLGGMLPLAWALNLEYAPKRYRATIVTVTMIGYSLGTALGGPVANWLMPQLGWKSAFVVGGTASLSICVILLFWLPESLRFLATKGLHSQVITKTLLRLVPASSIPPDVHFVISDEEAAREDFTPRLLFLGNLCWLTPLLWTAYIASSFAVFFLVNWIPLVFEALKYTRSDAAGAASLNSAMGALGGVLLMRFTDRYGVIAITAMPIMAVFLLLVAGVANLGHSGLLLINSLIGGFLIGGHFGMHSISGIFYPSAYRANGAAWATSIAKIGAIAGPMVGGLVLSTTLPVRYIFFLLAICPTVFAVCIFLVGKLDSGRFR
jgi:AAHS family 4-hydroxybenzoate transporter-like MFS transporter